jgi:hypothetical protein
MNKNKNGQKIWIINKENIKVRDRHMKTCSRFYVTRNSNKAIELMKPIRGIMQGNGEGERDRGHIVGMCGKITVKPCYS